LNTLHDFLVLFNRCLPGPIKAVHPKHMHMRVGLRERVNNGLVVG
jgi:hypothetical protein